MTETDLQTAPTSANQADSQDRWWLVRRYRWPLLILAAHIPLLLVHFLNLWNRPQYQHFPLILAAFAMMLVARTRPAKRVQDDHAPLPTGAVSLWFVSLIIFLAATYFFSPWIASVSFVIAVAGFLLALQHDYVIESGWGICLICALMIPVPGNLESGLSQFLQRSTTETSGVLLTAMHVPNVVQGTTLSLSSGRLFVEEACSGIVSLMSVLATCLILAVLFRRSLIHTILLVASGVLWASAMNIVRIVTIAVCREKFQIDLAEGWEHTALGLIVYAGSFGLILSTDQLLTFLLAPGIYREEPNPVEDSPSVVIWRMLTRFGTSTPTESSADDHSSLLNPPLSLRQRTAVLFRTPVMMGLVAAFALLGIVGTGRAIARVVAGGEVAMQKWDSPIVQSLSVEIMPETVDGWTRKGFRTSRQKRLFAQESRLWIYSRADANAVFSIDFAFHHWHNLCQCYTSIGWDQHGASDYKMLGNQPYVQAEFFKSTRESGELYFCLCDTRGNLIQPLEALPPLEQLKQRAATDQTLIQIQLWVTRPRKPTELDSQKDERLFIELRDRTLELIADQESRTEQSSVPFGADAP